MGQAHAQPTASIDAKIITGPEHGLTKVWIVSFFLEQKFEPCNLFPNFGIDHIVAAPKTGCEYSVSLQSHKERKPRPSAHCGLSLVCPFQ